KKMLIFVTILTLCPVFLFAQGGIKWSPDGNGYYRSEGGEIVRYALPQMTKTMLVSKNQLTPSGGAALQVRNFSISADEKKVLIFTNTKKVWRLQTRGDYWYLDLAAGAIHKLGESRTASS